MTEITYKNLVAVLELLNHCNADVRAAFEDNAQHDQLANGVITVHPELRECFSTIGFRSTLPPIPPSLRPVGPEVDVHTACGPTPTVRIPGSRRKSGIVLQAAVDATRLLRDSGHICTIFGCTAYHLYGNKRHPNDVDILISSSENAEHIKRSPVNQDPLHFYFRRANTLGATHIKVDVVMAGTMMLPFLSSRSAVVKDGLPLVPLKVLLLHTLQGCHDHMTASEPYKQMKQTVNVADVQCILKIVTRSLTGNGRPWASVVLSCFQQEFRRLTVERIKKFCYEFSDYRDDWYRLGFKIT
ncbi:hypothetical protein EDD18DRAFT_1358317 [Armillaria luteobubalina]|uniref:Nucleotidyltransferase n=1 Tax=Armillaria luteobubalina TaxID=153913 RepID=A0AA39PXE3_9AGAR|nr:hypothetical protein EDD18DRAFT_1358317 [Armillaria luteobubalina]